ncbi:hypothetical protein [Variovorax durovernensis]
MNPAPTTNAFRASLSCQNLATEDAVRLLKADPSFWAAIRPSWLVDSTWRPRIGAFAHWTPPDVGAEQVAVLVTSPPNALKTTRASAGTASQRRQAVTRRCPPTS